MDAHDQGLQHDLALIRRRSAIAWMAGGLVAGCSETRGAAAAALGCVANPRETAGPYPANGNGGRGRINVLEQSGIVRRDIRASLASDAVADGVPVTITLTLTDASNGCAPLPGHAAYLWQCDRDGRYSLYDLPDISWLRGVQEADRDGRLSFTTIFPATYPGRYPHMHFEIFPSLAAAGNGRNALLTSQLVMPAALSTEIYASAEGYESSRTAFRDLGFDRDFVFGDNDRSQLASMTPRFSGSIREGLRASSTIGIAA